jgi:hypothetical protein
VDRVEQKQRRRAANIRLAIILALVAVGFYVAFMFVGMPYARG